MPGKCSALNCKTGYAGQPRVKDVTVHCFPLHDSVLLKKWIHALRRENWQPTKHSRLCSLHFGPDDFEMERTEKRASVKRTKGKAF